MDYKYIYSNKQGWKDVYPANALKHVIQIRLQLCSLYK